MTDFKELLRVLMHGSETPFILLKVAAHAVGMKKNKRYDDLGHSHVSYRKY